MNVAKTLNPASEACSGVQISVGVYTILNDGGMTPMITCGSRSMVIVRPMTAASPPKRRCQTPCPSTATRASSRSSSTVNVRPRCGSPPKSANAPGDTLPAVTLSGSASSVPMARSRAQMPSTRSTRSSRSRKRTNVRKSSGLRSVTAESPGGIRNSCTSRSSCGKGRGRTMVALTTATTALAAPITRASVATTTAAYVGRRRSPRTACRRSRVRVSNTWPPGGSDAGEAALPAMGPRYDRVTNESISFVASK